MRIALFCGSAAGALIFGAAFWAAGESISRNLSAEHFLLFELPSLVLAGAAAAGVYLVGRGWPYREGEGLACAHCGHPWSPETNRLHSECQECGAPWRWFGGRVRGRPVRRPGLILGGVLLCALALAIVVLRQTAAARLALSSPPWLLVRSVEVLPWHEATVQWQALMSRGLNAADTELLARAILRKRQRDRFIPARLASWFDGAASRSAIPRPLIDRWYDEMFEVRLSAPARAVVGERVNVLARAEYLGGWFGVAEQAYVVVSGLTVSGEDGVRARDHRPVSAALFARGGTVVNESLYAEKEGQLKVRLSVYFLIGDPPPALAFDIDGAPAVGPTVYLRRFDLEHTVEIDPAPPP